MKKFDFPKDTIFSGELAFIPKPKDEGGGFKTVNLNTGKEYDTLSDDVFSNNKNSNDDINKKQENNTPIEFLIDYEDLIIKDVDIKDDIPMDASMDASIDDKNIDENISNKKNSAKPKLTKDEVYKNIHKGHRERMKNRFLEYGLENFAEHEVLEFLLYFVHERRDTNPVAHELINEFGDLNKVFKADIHDLKSVNGVGEQSAILISFCRQLITYLNANIKDRICLADATSAGLFCCNYFMQHTEESFIAIMLDTKRCIQKIAVISKGTENETAYYPRNVIKATIKHKANMVMIAHNHTGNSVHPSNNDIVLSNKINKLLDGIGVPLIDHIICCENIFTSLSERELIKNF